MLYDKRWELDESSRTLLAAIDYLEEHGHCKGRIEDDDGRVCVMGAVLRASGGNNSTYIRAMERLGIPRPWDWNDNPDRTKEQVVARLRKEALGCRK